MPREGDPSGCWWPPSYSTWNTTTVSFSFSVSLIVAQFTIFGIFSGPKLLELFWCPKQRFFGEIGANMGLQSMFSTQKLYFSDRCLNEVFWVSNGNCMPKLWPREVDVPIYLNAAHSFGTSSPKIRFLDVYGFPLFLNNK